METVYVLDVATREELREWFIANHDTCNEVWVVCNRSKCASACGLPYFDVVYEALCFGWIDSTCKRIGDRMLQRLTPRRAGSNWTELNKERCRYLERCGLMTDAGRKVLPGDMCEESFEADEDIVMELRKDPVVAANFERFPELYKRVRIGNIRMKRGDEVMYRRRLDKFIEYTRRNVMYGNWNDDGRLL